MKDAKYPVMYTCMPKLKQTTEKERRLATLEELECWVPVACWVLSKREHYRQDGTSFIDYEVVYTKDCHSLEEIDFPDERKIDTITVKEDDEISEDYETIKFLCVNRNQELLKTKFVADNEEWRKIQSNFLEKEIKYFAESFNFETKSKKMKK